MCTRLIQLLIFTNVATASFLPVLSKVQSALQDHIKSVEASAPTFTQEPTIYDPADIDFGPAPEDATPGEVKVCTGVDDTGTCDVVHTNLGECRNLSAVFKKNVLSVYPDKRQLCLLYDDDDCYGDAEWVKWPGVGNLRGRISKGGSWAARVVSFRCTSEN